MVGGESRKSRRRLIATESRASINSRCASRKFDIPSKNTNFNRLTSFTVRNSPNNLAAQGKRVSERPTAMMSSENTGDVMVDNSLATTEERRSPELGPATQAPTCRDRRTLSGDRSRHPAHHQFKLACEPTQNYLLAEPPLVPNRRVSKVSAHASNRTGAQLALIRRSM